MFTEEFQVLADDFIIARRRLQGGDLLHEANLTPEPPNSHPKTDQIRGMAKA
jgi:hypothetical protein